jgi:hypothetical protein
MIGKWLCMKYQPSLWNVIATIGGFGKIFIITEIKNLAEK